MKDNGSVSGMRHHLLQVLAALSIAYSAPGAAVQVTISDACGNSLAGTNASTSVNSSGDLSVSGVTAPYTAMFGCEAPVPATPSCTLSASQTRVAPTGSLTLYAKCSSSPTSWNWTIPPNSPATPSGGSATIQFAVPGAYTYSVSAANAFGPGPASNQLTILVADATTPPVCTLTASPVAIVSNAKSRLQAVCNPAAASYVWTADTGAAAPPASSSAGGELTFTNPGTFVYKVQGVGAANGPVATAVVTVAAAPPPPPPPPSSLPSFVNGSFETPVVSAGNTAIIPLSTPGWTPTGSTGIVTNEYFGNSSIPDGAQAAMYAVNAKLRQDVTIPTAGTYNISFNAMRDGANGSLRLKLLMDGVQIGDAISLNGGQFFPYTITFSVGTAGSHRFEFAGFSGRPLYANDGYVFIDNVRFTP